jgi:hypothetical protein
MHHLNNNKKNNDVIITVATLVTHNNNRPYVRRGTTTPVAATTTTTTTASNTTTTSTAPSSGLELSPQPIWDEQATTTCRIQINETHSIVSFIGNGTMTVPDTGETINMTNNGTVFVSSVPGYTDTVSAYGREHVFSEDDEDTTAITFYEIIRYDPKTLEGKELVTAVFDRNATSMLGPFNGIMVVGTQEEDPNTQAATIRLWKWQSGIPLPTAATTTIMEGPPQMNTTETATNTTTTSADTNATATPDEQGEGDEQQQQQEQTIQQYQHRCWNNNHSWQSKQLLFMYHLF